MGCQCYIVCNSVIRCKVDVISDQTISYINLDLFVSTEPPKQFIHTPTPVYFEMGKLFWYDAGS